MVKGISKRVIVVRSPDVRYFEQAIFIVRDDAVMQKGVSADQVLQEACRVASGYVRASKKNFLAKIPAPAFFALGVAASAGVWALTFFIF